MSVRDCMRELPRRTELMLATDHVASRKPKRKRFPFQKTR